MKVAGMSAGLQEEAARARRSCEETIVGEEDAARSIHSLVQGVCNGEGGSAIIFGPRHSGRSSVLMDILERQEYNDRLVVKTFCLSRFGNNTTALNSLLESEAESLPCAIVVESAEELVEKARQALLYRLLDRTKTRAWLVLLVLHRQDVLGSLEKRVRSRLGTTRILVGKAFSLGSWLLASRQVLSHPDSSPSWIDFIDHFLSQEEVVESLINLFHMSHSWSSLKLQLEAWLVLLAAGVEAKLAGVETVKWAEHIWRMALDAGVSAEHSLILTLTRVLKEMELLILLPLTGLSRRRFGLLVCAARRLKCQPDSSVSYGRLSVDYRLQCNETDKRMLPPDDLLTFIELDFLCSVGLLDPVGTAKEAYSHRAVSVGLPLSILLPTLRSLASPSLAHWMDGIPIN